MLNREETQLSTQQIIMTILDENIDGLAVDQIYIQLNLIKSCSLSSVYRLLSEMKKLGVVQKIQFSRQKAIYTISKQKVKCKVSNVGGELFDCNDQGLIMDFEQLFDKYKNEFSNIDIILYEK